MIRLLNEKLSLDDFRSTATRHIEQEGKPVTVKWYDGKTKVAEVLDDTEPAVDGYRWIGNSLFMRLNRRGKTLSPKE